MELTQVDWTPGSVLRERLFFHVTDVLNAACRLPEFTVEDGATGPLIRHIPTEVRIGLRPSMPANAAKPFDIWVRLTHRFPVRRDGTFNTGLVLRRVREVRKLRYPEFP